MRIINVISLADNNTQDIVSYGIFEEQLSDEVVEKAEAEFIKRAKELGMEDEEIDYHLQNGYYENGVYAVNFVWSNI